MFNFHPYLGKIPILTNSFQMVCTTNQVFWGSFKSFIRPDFLFHAHEMLLVLGTNLLLGGSSQLVVHHHEP